MKQLLKRAGILFLFLSLIWSQDKSELVVDIVVSSDHGWPTKIQITGSLAQEIGWLGISLYPYNVSDPITGGRHSHIDLEQGDFSFEIEVDQPLLGGSFEIAIWGAKVDKIDCTLDYCHWCKTNGFHFDKLIVYKSGLLNVMKGYDKQ